KEYYHNICILFHIFYSFFDILNLANNHSMDYGPDALIDTIKVLKENDIIPIGAGKNLAEAKKGAIIELKNIKAGFLAYTLLLAKSWIVRKSSPGVCPAYNKYIKEGIKNMKQNTDIVVVFF
ncbi:unnamed protein product, partial [marine sediment metagenome]